MNACEMGSLLLCIVLNVDQSVLLCSLCVPDIDCVFDLCALSSLSPLLLTTVFKPLSILSGGDSKCILYSNKDTNAYVPKTYSNANNIYSIAYNTNDYMSNTIVAIMIYSIDLRSRKFASQFGL